MLTRLVRALIGSKNEAADEALLEALRLGTERERGVALGALLRRQTTRGLGGVIELYDQLSEDLQRYVLHHVKTFHHALRECGRSERVELRLAALRLIALGRQGKLAYVISENLHESDERLSKAAVEAMVALARWVASETRGLQKGVSVCGSVGVSESENADIPTPRHSETYSRLMENRPEIEAAVARAMDVHRGRHGQELLRAGLLLCDWPGGRMLAILHTAKHGGQGALVRRLQQPPAAEHVEAFLLGASHGGLRAHFGSAFAQIDEAPVLDALVRKTHWLKDAQLQICMHQVARGAWWGDEELARDVGRRSPGDAAKVGEWIAASATHDVTQDQRLARLLVHARGDFAARLRLLRIALGRKRGASVQLIRAFLNDPDERLVRLAAREIVRRRPPDFENMLLRLMTGAPESVRRVVARAIGHVGFDQFWQRFDRLDPAARRHAGRAMLKLLPDAMQRLARRLGADPAEQRIKAMQIVQELRLGEQLHGAVVPLCQHPSARVRSKAVSVLGEMPASAATGALLDRVVNDPDPRVRANAIEVMETARGGEYVPLLAARVRSPHGRERANAIKAMHRLRAPGAPAALAQMLRDGRPEHRISAMWTLRRTGSWALLGEVGRIAKNDANHRVRRYAFGVLKSVAEEVQAARKSG